jgi:rsbT co-antagonist protein RsbR
MDDVSERESIIQQMLGSLHALASGNLRATLPRVDDKHGSVAQLAAALGAVVEAWRASEKKARLAKRELEGKIATIETQAAAIRELSTPVLEIWEDVLLLPIVGVLDRRRGQSLLEDLLPAVSKANATHVIIDITGVELVDVETANQLVKLVKAAELLGASCVLTGIRPAVAETLVHDAAGLSGLRTVRTLRAGLSHCLAGRRQR